MKKSLCILCSTVTALSLAACGTAQVSASEAAETTTVSTEELTTVTGKVTEIGGTSVTLALGEVSENSDGNTAPDNSNNSDSAPDGNGGFGGSSEVTQGDSANTITEDGTYTGTTYTSTGDDENALRVDGTTVTSDGITVDKQSGTTSNTENGDFYGMNAALLATNGATVTIKKATLTANNSEALVIEGQNSIALENCDVTGNMSDTQGSSGSNGAQVEFTADSQTLNGDIIVDNISTLDFSLTNGSVLNGTINFNGYTITLADGTVLK